MRPSLRRASDRSTWTPGRARRRRWKPCFDRLESKALLSATIVDLGDLGGGSSQAEGINSLGQVVGYSKTASGEDHAFLYSNGTMTDLGSLASSSYAFGINDSGTVVGYNSDDATGKSIAFEYSDGVMTSLGSLQGESGFSFAFGVNKSGEVVGYSTTASGGEDAFLYYGGTMTDLGGLATDSQGNSLGSQATAINDSGQIVGFAGVLTDNGDGVADHAFIDSGGTMTDLGAGDGSTALGINNAGQVIGVWASGYYVESNGVFTNLSALPAGINDNGDIVGYSQNNPYLYTNGQTIALSSLLPANSGWTLTNAVAINNSDQIVGTGTYQGKQQAYLLTLNAAKASPTLVTTASPAAITLHGSGSPTLTDSAVLSGGSDPTGTITFTLSGPSGNTVDTESVKVDGDGTYTTPNGYTLPTSGTVVGTYTWAASYTGDGSNNPAKDKGGDAEQTVVSLVSVQPPHVTDIVSASQTKKGLTGITVVFDEALDGKVVNDQALFHVLGAVTKHNKTVYTEAVRIKGISFDGQTRVTINLAKPYKGAVKVTVLAGIPAANGASSDANFSAVVP